MGIDVRDVPAAVIDTLPNELRKAGFEVEVIESVSAHPPQAALTTVTCRRGADVQLIAWGSKDTESGTRRIGIHHYRGWLWWVRRRRRALQADVTRVIEEQGGRWPFLD